MFCFILVIYNRWCFLIFFFSIWILFEIYLVSLKMRNGLLWWLLIWNCCWSIFVNCSWWFNWLVIVDVENWCIFVLFVIIWMLGFLFIVKRGWRYGFWVWLVFLWLLMRCKDWVFVIGGGCFVFCIIWFWEFIRILL